MLAAQPAVVGSGGSGGNSGGDISTAMTRVRTCEFVSELSRLTTTTTEYFYPFFSTIFYAFIDYIILFHSLASVLPTVASRWLSTLGTWLPPGHYPF